MQHHNWTKLFLGCIFTTVGIYLLSSFGHELMSPEVAKNYSILTSTLAMVKKDSLFMFQLSVTDINTINGVNITNQLMDVYGFSKQDASILVKYYKLVKLNVPGVHNISELMDSSLDGLSPENVREIFPSPCKTTLPLGGSVITTLK
jgi:hypothetical protein